MRTDARAPELKVEIQYASEEEEPPSPRAVRHILCAVFERPAQVTVRFVGLEEGASLNERHRGGKGPTNVLSFGYGEDDAGRVLGDIALCCPVVREEALGRGLSLADHYAHLLVHGALHLQGYAHDHGDEEALMQERETRVLAAIGVPSPWEAGA